MTENVVAYIRASPPVFGASFHSFCNGAEIGKWALATSLPPGLFAFAPPEDTEG
jgi:hypothetical protein